MGICISSYIPNLSELYVLLNAAKVYRAFRLLCHNPVYKRYLRKIKNNFHVICPYQIFIFVASEIQVLFLYAPPTT